MNVSLQNGRALVMVTMNEDAFSEGELIAFVDQFKKMMEQEIDPVQWKKCA